MAVQIVAQAFDPLELLRRHQAGLGAPARRIGALASFVGSMRDMNEGAEVTAMTIEHYPGMTERHIEQLVADTTARYSLDDCLVVHRVGRVEPGDTIVLVATWAAHRAHAFESCRAIMEALKSSAPLWKKEDTRAGARWVANNTPGEVTAFEADTP